jgi:hypothetical protein
VSEFDWDVPLTEPSAMYPDPCPGECGTYVPRGAGKCIACFLKYNPRSVRIDRRNRRKDNPGRSRF